jgi:hypothetical protein
LPGASRDVYLNPVAKWDNFGGNWQTAKHSYRQIGMLSDTRIRSTKPGAKPIRLSDEKGLYLPFIASDLPRMRAVQTPSPPKLPFGLVERRIGRERLSNPRA